LDYVFEDFCLDAGRRELRRGSELVSIEPLVFDLLEFLLRTRDRVVSKDNLIASVWHGRIVSESTLTSRMNAARQALGDSGQQQRLIRTISRKGFRFVGEVRELEHRQMNGPPPAAPIVDAMANKQAVTFCRTRDGVGIAVARVGSGPPLVRTNYLVSHIEYDWDYPYHGPLLQRLARQWEVTRYDGRGMGLSDRDVREISLETHIADLEAVVDTLKLERFSILGISAGAATAIAYASRHPDRVSNLVLYGGYALGRNKRHSPQTTEEARAFVTMLRSGWGDTNSVFWRAFSSFFISNATNEQLRHFLEYQFVATTMENAIKARMAVDDIDITAHLANLRAPAIIFHCLRDTLVPFEQGRLLGASIPNAKFVALDSANHLLLAQEPAWEKFVGDMEAFLLHQEPA
jgi:DNA-binding winged helix-turn-helix (wHTH) protein/pimeloyl-ACP methyl ester carboxylesterase